MSESSLSVECPCGAVMTHEELAPLVEVVQSHAKLNHNMDLTEEDVHNMASKR